MGKALPTAPDFRYVDPRNEIKKYAGKICQLCSPCYHGRNINTCPKFNDRWGYYESLKTLSK